MPILKRSFPPQLTLTTSQAAALKQFKCTEPVGHCKGLGGAKVGAGAGDPSRTRKRNPVKSKGSSSSSGSGSSSSSSCYSGSSSSGSGPYTADEPPAKKIKQSQAGASATSHSLLEEKNSCTSCSSRKASSSVSGANDAGVLGAVGNCEAAIPPVDPVKKRFTGRRGFVPPRRTTPKPKPNTPCAVAATHPCGTVASAHATATPPEHMGAAALGDGGGGLGSSSLEGALAALDAKDAEEGGNPSVGRRLAQQRASLQLKALVAAR